MQTKTAPFPLLSPSSHRMSFSSPKLDSGCKKILFSQRTPPVFPHVYIMRNSFSPGDVENSVEFVKNPLSQAVLHIPPFFPPRWIMATPRFFFLKKNEISLGATSQIPTKSWAKRCFCPRILCQVPRDKFLSHILSTGI